MHELDSDFQQFAPTDDWKAIRSWRRDQRSRFIAQRKALSSDERQRASETIIKLLVSEPKFFAGSCGFYWPLKGEIDLRALMYQLVDRGCAIALPVIVEKDKPMEFWAWCRTTQMRKQPVWNIPVPIEGNPMVPSVLFVPLLGFDAHGHRLGHGGGYYDRTLENVVPKPLTVGIGYEFGKLETIYPRGHDVPMDVIVTEHGIVRTIG